MNNKHGRQPTLNDVASQAGVSRQTVSRVVNNKGEISEPTRQRVQMVIDELGYHPNSLARSLVTRRNLVIGLTLPNIDQPYFPQIARGVEDAAAAVGYSVFLCNASGDPDRELQSLERLRGHRVAGIISFNSRLDDVTIDRVVGGLFPIVMINRELPSADGTIIWMGYESGAKLATEHVIGIGRQRIVFLGTDLNSNVDAEKRCGYERALEDAGIPLDTELILRTAWKLGRDANALVEGGQSTIRAAIAAAKSFDAIVASNDLAAIGAMRELIGCGVRVPDDVAIVGFGNASVTSIVTPSLSTVTMPLYEMGITALETLLDRITTDEWHPRRTERAPELIVRGSSSLIDRTVTDPGHYSSTVTLSADQR